MFILVVVMDLIRVQSFHYLTVAWVKILAVDMSSSVHIDNNFLL